MQHLYNIQKLKKFYTKSNYQYQYYNSQNRQFDKGFKKIASNLSFHLGGEFSIKTNSSGVLLLLNYSYSSSVITIVNLKTKKVITHKAFSDENQPNKLHFFPYDFHFYFTDNVNFWKVLRFSFF